MAQYQFQAVDSETGDLYQWVDSSLDWDGTNYPGPNSPTEIAVVGELSGGGGGGDLAATLTAGNDAGGLEALNLGAIRGADTYRQTQVSGVNVTSSYYTSLQPIIRALGTIEFPAQCAADHEWADHDYGKITWTIVLYNATTHARYFETVTRWAVRDDDGNVAGMSWINDPVWSPGVLPLGTDSNEFEVTFDFSGYSPRMTITSHFSATIKTAVWVKSEWFTHVGGMGSNGPFPGI